MSGHPNYRRSRPLKLKQIHEQLISLESEELFNVNSSDDNGSDVSLDALVAEDEPLGEDDNENEEIYPIEPNDEDFREDYNEELQDQQDIYQQEVPPTHSTPIKHQRQAWGVPDSDENPDPVEDSLEHSTNQQIIEESDEKMSTDSDQDLENRSGNMSVFDDSFIDPSYQTDWDQVQTRENQYLGYQRGSKGRGRDAVPNSVYYDSESDSEEEAETRACRPRGRSRGRSRGHPRGRSRGHPRGRPRGTAGRNIGRGMLPTHVMYEGEGDNQEEEIQTRGRRTRGRPRGSRSRGRNNLTYREELHSNWDYDYDEIPPKIEVPRLTIKKLQQKHKEFHKYYVEPRPEINIGKFDFEPKRPPGPNPDIFPQDRGYKELQVFENFHTDRLIDQILGFSNNYGREKIQGNFKEITIKEFRLFEQILFYMGAFKKPKMTDYWSKDWYKGSSPCTDMLSRNRFQQILRCLIFTNDRQMPENGDRLYRSRELMTQLNTIYSTNYYPHEGISVDESLVGYHGNRSGCVVKNDKKESREGYKQYKGNCAKTGYTLKVETYSNSPADKYYKIDELEDYDISDFTDPAKIVLYFMQHYLQVGHTLATDSFYTDTRLFRILVEEHTNCVGTVQDRKYMPSRSKIKNLKYMKPDEILHWYSRPICTDKCLLITAWRDKKIVRTISSFHNHTEREPLEETEKRREKKRNAELPNRPKFIVDYKKYMPGVDKSDQQMSYYNCKRMGLKRPHKLLYMNSLEISCHNAFIVYNDLMEPKKINPYYSYLDFKESLFEQTLKKYKPNHRIIQKEQVMRSNMEVIDEARYNTSLPHIPIKCDSYINASGNITHTSGTCKQCSYQCNIGHQDCNSKCIGKKRKRASFKCKLCNEFLHIEQDGESNCFDKWHIPGIGRVRVSDQLLCNILIYQLAMISYYLHIVIG